MTPSAPSRRRVLSGGVALAGAAALGPTLLPGTAEAAVHAPRRFRVYPYARTPVPNAWQRHLMNRMGCGFSPRTYAQLRHNGSAQAWFDRQLAGTRWIPDSAVERALPAWFPDLTEPASTKWAKNKAGTKGGWEYARDFAGYSLLRQIHSDRQVLENMVGFWSNHLHVHADTDLGWVHRVSYDEVIRTHALGRFEDLLVACSLHPAMLLYLDNWTSVRGAPNENQGRELLELHTVGRAAGYTEDMVKDSARILSGWTVDAFGTWEGSYSPERHTTGPVRVLGFSHANASPDGSELTKDYLRYLANHPATALTIARKLARHFVADQPSTALVTSLARVFRDSGTDITATLRALVAHPDFRASRGRLVRNPIEDFVATCRVLGVTPDRPTEDQSFARAIPWVPRTTVLYQWPRPDGLPLGDAAWSSATRMLSSFRMHWSMAAGWWPVKDVTYRSAQSWLPQPSLRFDRFVDHLCRVLLGRGSSPRLLGAAVAATGVTPATQISKDHAVCTWMFVRLAGVLLDSPDHMRR